ncbi:MAG: phosphotransferase, partial [Candidatus Thorarchaeota archaeon]
MKQELTALKISNDIQQDIHDHLTSIYPEMGQRMMSSFSQILGGATHTIFSFDLVSDSDTVPLILRIYTRNQAEGAQNEFRTIRLLYDSGLQVSRPYVLVMDSRTMGTPYMILERIEGPMLSDVLMDLRSGSRFDYLVKQYANNMAAFHSLNWSEYFLYLDSRGLRDYPETYVMRDLAKPKEIITEHGVNELLPAIEWMEENAITTIHPCLIHGDYHGMNIIVRNEEELVTIDWNAAKIGDYRSDLAYSILTLASANLDIEKTIVQQYERVTGRKVQGLDYFKALSSIWNLLRIYSCLIDRNIMSETDETVRLFIDEYHDFSRSTI